MSPTLFRHINDLCGHRDSGESRLYHDIWRTDHCHDGAVRRLTRIDVQHLYTINSFDRINDLIDDSKVTPF
jgi:hypothetical protein